MEEKPALPPSDKPIVSVDPPQKSTPSVAPAIAGAGIGTLLLYLAERLPNSGFKTVLVLSAPTITIAANVFWRWLLKWWNARQTERVLKWRIEQYKKYLSEELADPKLSKGHKKNLQDKYDQLSQLQADLHWKRISAITPNNELISLLNDLQKRFDKE
jgi:hypothetical protein